jgi:transcriptional regulator with XRE-family HTH domain
MKSGLELGRVSPALDALRVSLIVERARLRLSQEALAERSGVSRPTISRIERGAAVDVGLDVIERLARALDISVAKLFAPQSRARVDDPELARRAAASDDEFVDARALFEAIDEAEGREIERYSRAGRPPLAR